MKTTQVYDETVIALAKSRIVVSRGGSSSSKSISAMQIFTNIAMMVPNQVITIVGESKPVLKRSVLHDWKTIIMGDRFKQKQFHGTDLIYTFESGSIMQFVPADDEARFHGPRQDYVLIDEASNVSEGVFRQLIIRTNKKMIITFNPSHEFWAKKIIDRDDCTEVHSTVLMNEFASKDIVNELKRMADLDDNFYRVYFLGEWGSLEGMVFQEGKHWRVVKDSEWVNDNNKKIWSGYGLDFGYEDHASALIEAFETDENIFARQRFWSPGMKTQELYDECEKITDGEDIAADSAEGRLIDELEDMGLNIHGAQKGPGSVKYGINLLKQKQILIHEDSVDMIRDFRGYRWKKNRNGEILSGQPVKLLDEGPDALRYIADHMMADPVDGSYFVS